MSGNVSSRASVLSALIIIFGQSAFPVSAATLFSTNVTDGPNWLGSMLSDGVTSVQSQEITLTSLSNVTTLQWTGRYCYLDGGGCLKTGYESLVDDFHVLLEGVEFQNPVVLRSSDLGWSRNSATLEYTLSLTDLIIGPGSFTLSIWNELPSSSLLGWYWDFGGDSGKDLSITAKGEVVASVPLPFPGLSLLGGLGLLGLIRRGRSIELPETDAPDPAARAPAI